MTTCDICKKEVELAHIKKIERVSTSVENTRELSDPINLIIGVECLGNGPGITRAYHEKLNPITEPSPDLSEEQAMSLEVEGNDDREPNHPTRDPGGETTTPAEPSDPI